MHDYLDILPEVAVAIANNKPVVALESTIISHGMPYPQNVETAKRVEDQVRASGAVPATIAIMDGRLKVGLSSEEIDYLGRKGFEAVKASRRDIPFIISRKLTGATTVASTMIVAAMAGIPVFATGGIGGVHRGASETMDISADLQELAQTNVVVVSAGAKAILDLKLTREYLETHGVPVVGFKTDEFPAFYTRKSGLKVDYRVDDVEELAQAMKVKWDMGLNGGILLANPIPEAAQMAYAPINEAISQAIEEAETQGVEGKALTPFLLGRIKDLTGGESLKANIQLVLNNARVAAQLAVAYAKIRM
jgi:pseudouridine-5'-phosphate glycosidase